MKTKIKFCVIVILVICLIIFWGTKVDAAMEIKPGTTTHLNITVSDAYQYCYDLRNRTSTLSKNTLDPHLSLNADWGAVACLSLSSYGYGKAANNLTDSFTNGNNSGVLDFGKNATYTSGIRLKCIDGISSDDKSRGKLIQNINTKYVEGLKEKYTEEDTIYKELEFLNSSTVAFSSGFSVPVRVFFLGRRLEITGNNNAGWGGDGVTDKRTFRPVIWN